MANTQGNLRVVSDRSLNVIHRPNIVDCSFCQFNYTNHERKLCGLTKYVGPHKIF